VVRFEAERPQERKRVIGGKRGRSGMGRIRKRGKYESERGKRRQKLCGGEKNLNRKGPAEEKLPGGFPTSKKITGWSKRRDVLDDGAEASCWKGEETKRKCPTIVPIVKAVRKSADFRKKKQQVKNSSTKKKGSPKYEIEE